MADLTAAWIAGLMRENYDAVGFIPEPTVERQYVRRGRVIAQHAENGVAVGYLLHGAPVMGRALTVAQHCIQYERRRRGYGEAAMTELIQRAEKASASCITARVATDLEALTFWLAQGFVLRGIVAGGTKRDRQIAKLWLPLTLPIFESDQPAAAEEA